MRPNLLKIWSGRRESDPQPTAWKAVTLPLSYSRSNRFQTHYIKPASNPGLVRGKSPREDRNGLIHMLLRNDIRRQESEHGLVGTVQ